MISWLFTVEPHLLAQRYRPRYWPAASSPLLPDRIELRFGALPANGADGDRCVAAVTIRLSVPLVSHDGVFDQAPGLD